jgi:hypothetical protein
MDMGENELVEAKKNQGTMKIVNCEKCDYVLNYENHSKLC